MLENGAKGDKAVPFTLEHEYKGQRKKNKKISLYLSQVKLANSIQELWNQNSKLIMIYSMEKAKLKKIGSWDFKQWNRLCSIDC